MRDIFSEGLLYLDLLEIYGSTYAVAEICGIAQSNVFRGASSCSKLLNLGLSKDRQSGRYRIEKNHDVQRDLRRLNQRIRARENGRLRLVDAFGFLDGYVSSFDELKSYQLLPMAWDDHELSFGYLEQALIDLLIIPRSSLPSSFLVPTTVRRRDLFVPANRLAVAELSSISYRLLAHPGHPLCQADCRFDPATYSWHVDSRISLNFLLKSYPSSHFLPCVWDASTLDRVLSESLAADHSLLLANHLQCQSIGENTADSGLVPLDVSVHLDDQFLLVTPLALIQEPQHHSFMQMLRRYSAQLDDESPDCV